ncbi:MAG TPA: hypothetical protein VH560_06800 [Polyangia bacterium]|jgi:modulator of FtsH protease|nr:hypothetical protein [Polyangia bacterium]
MHAYSTAGWENFFVAEVGAAAALTGLLFVAVSINLTKILALPQLPGRAGESLLILMGALATATLGLVPGQPSTTLGVELLAVLAPVWAFPMLLQAHARVPGAPAHWIWTRVVFHQIATLPMLAAGVSLCVGAGGGLYWLVAGTILSFTAAVLNAWVLLIEIQR